MAVALHFMYYNFCRANPMALQLLNIVAGVVPVALAVLAIMWVIWKLTD